MNDESENNLCRRRKGTKRLLIMTSLVLLGIGILFVVTLINVEPGSSGKYSLKLFRLTSFQGRDTKLERF